MSVCCEAPDDRQKNSHAICLVRKRIDDQLLVLLSPILHFSVRMNDRFDVLDYVMLWPS